ncbi:hypothetical protein CC78DRAFT_612638 [Lojkania enalia]|uniref:Uncharacterized protein n=1 Tax=Lojkania enalia TaxID=147567 RepID=A0A9P4N9N3_9PLEO|nr:hypothetical protein CC78DRAFT_612638 [Didymosphaeria enalia]
MASDQLPPLKVGNNPARTCNTSSIQLSNDPIEFMQHLEVRNDHSFKGAGQILYDRTKNPPQIIFPGQANKPSNAPPHEVHETCGRSLSEADIIPCYTSATLRRKKFVEAMEKLEASLPEKQRTNLVIHSAHSWEDVFKIAKSAEDAYYAKADKSSAKSWIRSCFRAFQQHSVVLENWIGIIPTQETWASVLCGGLKLILTAMTRMHEVRETIYEALATLPTEVQNAEDYLDISSSNLFVEPQHLLRLHSTIANLYISILDVLEHIIHWLGRKSVFRHLPALLVQKDYESSLFEKVRQYQVNIRVVKDQTQLCFEGMVVRYLKHNADQTEKLKTMFDTLASSPRINQYTLQLQNISNTDVHATIHKTDVYISESASRVSMQMLNEQTWLDPENPLSDFSYIFSQIWNMPKEECKRLNSITQQRKFHDWLAKADYPALLVNGDAGDRHNAMPTTSVFAAGLIDVLRHHSDFFHAYWFCGEHRDAQRDIDASMARVICYFIRQLLKQCAEHNCDSLSRFQVRRDDLEAVRCGDTQKLCSIFVELILQLPPNKIIFCIIDCPSALKDLNSLQSDEVDWVIAQLHNAAHISRPNGPVLKILVTEPGGMFSTSGLFGSEERAHITAEDIAMASLEPAKVLLDRKASCALNEIAQNAAQVPDYGPYLASQHP